MLAARLAGQQHRSDWWNVFYEHTPYEWAAQHAMERVQPFGELRADIRAATNTTAVIAAQAMKELTDEQMAELFSSLAVYLNAFRPSETLVSPEQAAKMMGR